MDTLEVGYFTRAALIHETRGSHKRANKRGLIAIITMATIYLHVNKMTKYRSNEDMNMS